MKNIITLINTLIKNYKTKKSFKKLFLNGIDVIIKGNDIDKIYELRQYESISKGGPYLMPVRAIKQEVYDWCLKRKDMVHFSDELPTEYNYELFYFGSEKDALEFKKTFNLN